MLRAPWGQESPPSGSRGSAASPHGGHQTAGGRSQIVFGNYHEPSSSSYKSMTNDAPSESPAAQSEYTSRIRAARSRDNSASDLFGSRAGGERESDMSTTYGRANSRAHMHGLAGSSGGGAIGGPGGSAGSGLRLRSDRNQSTIFDSDVPAGTRGSPLREHRSSSDIFNVQDDHLGGAARGSPLRQYRSSSDIFHVNESPNSSSVLGGTSPARYGSYERAAINSAPTMTASSPLAAAPRTPYSPERREASSPDKYSPEKYSPDRYELPRESLQQQGRRTDYERGYSPSPEKLSQRNEYAPSVATAVRRDPFNSILSHGDAAAAAEEGFRGRRHYPQQLRNNNIFQG
ncbi:hypothetical protein HKX48_002856 [Thoreauomyces humboldtii]|nr:hypothetical protein HKX48_002856 [Thoreauomyces humboldtii]